MLRVNYSGSMLPDRPKGLRPSPKFRNPQVAECIPHHLSSYMSPLVSNSYLSCGVYGDNTEW